MVLDACASSTVALMRLKTPLGRHPEIAEVTLLDQRSNHATLKPEQHLATLYPSPIMSADIFGIRITVKIPPTRRKE
jgi:hypothetical protein